jgi:hypothetical protein
VLEGHRADLIIPGEGRAARSADQIGLRYFSPVGWVSPAQRVQVDIAKFRQDDCVLKFADRRITGPRERDRASMLQREFARSSFG